MMYMRVGKGFRQAGWDTAHQGGEGFQAGQLGYSTIIYLNTMMITVIMILSKVLLYTYLVMMSPKAAEITGDMCKKII